MQRHQFQNTELLQDKSNIIMQYPKSI